MSAPRARFVDHLPHPRDTPERCAMRADSRGDVMLGTAFPAAQVLMVEQPGPWGRNGLRDSRFDRATAQALEKRANAAGLRVVAIRRPGRSAEPERRTWGIADCRPGSERLVWGTFADDAELLDLALDGSSGRRDRRPAYLVCAHSKHDACCAIRGRPVAAALSDLVPEQVWECSHLGGERFAANVLVLPFGLLYGRVLPLAVPEFVDASERGEVVGALLRGRVGFAPVVQAALAFAYDHLGVRRSGDLSVLAATPVVDGQAHVRLRGPYTALEVVVHVERREVAGLTCANPGPGFYLAFRPVSATPVPG
jgi:hypothetical protein